MEENLKMQPILTNLAFVTTLQGPNATQKYEELSLKSECGCLKSECGCLKSECGCLKSECKSLKSECKRLNIATNGVR